MARTQPRGGQLLDNSIQRDDLDASTVGQAVVRKVVDGSGIDLTSTGGDAGTGDVTVLLEDGGHGAAKHTDITRSIDVSPGMMVTDGAGAASGLGTAPDIIARFSLADGSTTGVYFQRLLPADAKANSPVSIAIIWSPVSTDSSSHAVRWSVDALAISDGGNVTSAGTTTAFTGTASAKTSAQRQTEPVTQVIASASAGDLLRIDVRRVGGDAADDYVGNVNLLAVRVEYTAVQ